MLKLNAFLKEKNVKFSLKRNKFEKFLSGIVEYTRKSTRELFISSLIQKNGGGSKLHKKNVDDLFITLSG